MCDKWKGHTADGRVRVRRVSSKEDLPVDTDRTADQVRQVRHLVRIQRLRYEAKDETCLCFVDDCTLNGGEMER
jgi:hypothetical protein